ncbi:hypothetical protein BV394_12620 [Brevirhabdus pacifica]|uniref:Uncharacterized protein n=1 Tax=Brevirhabdus pacifica TaxID=1267768 RepID=A0A1U7DKR7_9RHOB|nr:VOC family protein [Brevirhabdus pacifica]APX90468.1 hypothetical protein BV394_12620 [Brevirhabdus pacifica]OWU78514.1 hypothetical protein ATO5_06845 [Loktanella sp. 22II-4b]PJJ85430.1 PhnB protein [Brevirhabdus pacifica]
MPFTPYLHFDGTCAEAMKFYEDVFDGRDLFMMRFDEMPEDAGGDMPRSDRIMHATLKTDDGILYASDFPQGGEPQKAVSVSVPIKEVERARAIFDRLTSNGGEAAMPFGKTFFSSGFGVVRDRFGTHWFIMVDEPEGPMPDA